MDVYVSAGSNVAPEENLKLACRELTRRFGPLELSGVYRNPPVGFAGDDFLNLVLRFRTGEPPHAIVAELERLHTLAGRVRGLERFAPRTLDLDLLLYGSRSFRAGHPGAPRGHPEVWLCAGPAGGAGTRAAASRHGADHGGDSGPALTRPVIPWSGSAISRHERA